MIPHLQQQIAFLTACRDHGAENVEWRFSDPRNAFPQHWKFACNQTPAWEFDRTYEFRVRPRTHVIPRAEVPAEDTEGFYTIRVAISKIGSVFDERTPIQRYRTKQDRDAVLNAMLAREEE